MKRIKWMLLICACSVTAVYGQKTDRDYLRSGNKLYKDSLFVKAEVDYRKALEVNPKSADALYNLGNSLLMQEKERKRWSSWMRLPDLRKIRKNWLIFIITWA